LFKNQKNSKTAVLSVTNDLSADQRVNKVALTLVKCGFSPLLVGVKRKNSLPISNRRYRTKRMHLLFTKGPLFYAEYNVRLFMFLLFSKNSLFIANDLDSLSANYLAYKIKSIFFKNNVQIVYDSHEFFTEVPELNDRFAKKVWLFIEKLILPQIKHAYTVCESIAEEYKKKYGVNMQVVRNIPLCNTSKVTPIESTLVLNEFADKKIILYQGALNIGRGIEHVINAMEFIENAVFIIVGDGDIATELKNLTRNKKLVDKVYFVGKIPFSSLFQYTKNADIGIVLQEDLSLSYRYVLPNRIFDYIQAELPVIASDLPEIKKIYAENEIGLLVSDLSPENLAQKITYLLTNTEKRIQIKANLKSIKGKYCWEKEEEKLIKLFTKL